MNRWDRYTKNIHSYWSEFFGDNTVVHSLTSLSALILAILFVLLFFPWFLPASLVRAFRSGSTPGKAITMADMIPAQQEVYRLPVSFTRKGANS